MTHNFVIIEYRVPKYFVCGVSMWDFYAESTKIGSGSSQMISKPKKSFKFWHGPSKPEVANFHGFELQLDGQDKVIKVMDIYLPIRLNVK